VSDIFATIVLKVIPEKGHAIVIPAAIVLLLIK